MGILKEKGFDVEIVKGEVLSSDVRVESDVKGRIRINGSGGVQVNGTTYSPGTTTGGGEIKTEHTRIQDIFLKVGDKKERHFTTRNFVVPCRESHELALIVLRKHGEELPIMARIENTGEKMFDWSRVYDRLLPIHKMVPATLFIIVFIFGAIIAMNARSWGIFIVAFVLGLVVAHLGFHALSNHYRNRFNEDESWQLALKEIDGDQG